MCCLFTLSSLSLEINLCIISEIDFIIAGEGFGNVIKRVIKFRDYKSFNNYYFSKGFQVTFFQLFIINFGCTIIFKLFFCTILSRSTLNSNPNKLNSLVPHSSVVFTFKSSLLNLFLPIHITLVFIVFIFNPAKYLKFVQSCMQGFSGTIH